MTATLTPQYHEAEEAYRRAVTTEERLDYLKKMRAELDQCIQRSEPVWWSIPPIIELGNQTFYRDLPQLLKERPGQCVAYSGEKRLGFAKNAGELFDRCIREGYSEDEFVIHRVEPYDPNAIVMLGGVYPV